MGETMAASDFLMMQREYFKHRHTVFLHLAEVFKIVSLQQRRAGKRIFALSSVSDQILYFFSEVTKQLSVSWLNFASLLSSLLRNTHWLVRLYEDTQQTSKTVYDTRSLQDMRTASPQLIPVSELLEERVLLITTYLPNNKTVCSQQVKCLLEKESNGNIEISHQKTWNINTSSSEEGAIYKNTQNSKTSRKRGRSSVKKKVYLKEKKKKNILQLLS